MLHGTDIDVNGKFDYNVVFDAQICEAIILFNSPFFSISLHIFIRVKMLYYGLVQVTFNMAYCTKTLKKIAFN